MAPRLATMKLLVAFAVLLAVIAGVALRAISMTGELWLDEIWSLLLLDGVSSPVEILTKVRHDNNHPLNSAWLWLLGPDRSPELYRIPSVLFGALTLIVLPLTARREGMGLSGAAWCVLVALSYPCILLGSEARGYSLTIFACVVSFSAVLRLARGPASACWAAIFLVSSAAGILSHAAYLLFLVPATVWLAVVQMRRERAEAANGAAWLTVAAPLAGAAAVWALFYRSLEIGGGPRAPYLQVLVSTISVSFGGEEMSELDLEGSAAALLVAAAIVFVLLGEAAAWLRERDPVAVLVVGLVAFPVLAVVVLQPPFVMTRYGITAIVFMYLLAARFIARLARQGSLGGLLGAGLLALYAVGNLRHVEELRSFGRSHVLAAFEAIASGGATVTVGGDFDNQNELRLRFLRLRRAAVSPITYVREYASAVPAPQVVLRERLERGGAMPPEFSTPSGVTFRVVREYPAPLLSGSMLAVYSQAPGSGR